MAARIRSTVNGASALDEQSRDDLSLADVIVVASIDTATSYYWQLSFVPEGSTAAFSGLPTDVSPGSFVADKEGPYLVKLTVDAGLGTEDSQYVRLRALTTALGLKLVSGGEKRDATGTIPVDIDTEGWANEQNANLQALETAITSMHSYLPYILNMSGVANGVESYTGWVPVSCTLMSITVKMGSVNTEGNYTLTVTNITTGNSCLASTFNMNSLTNGNVSIVPLTGTGSDLNFSSNGKWGVVLTSDSPSFNGSDISIQLLFEV